MKKSILSLLTAAAVTLSLNAIAQEKKSKTPKETKTEKAEKENKGGKEKEKGKGKGKGSKLTPEQRADKHTKKFTEKLKLTDAQIPKVREILLERAKSVDADKERCKGDGKCMQDARKDRNKTAETKLKQVLTAEQFAKLQEIRKKARDKAKNKDNKNPEPEPKDDILETPEQ